MTMVIMITLCEAVGRARSRWCERTAHILVTARLHLEACGRPENLAQFRFTS